MTPKEIKEIESMILDFTKMIHSELNKDVISIITNKLKVNGVIKNKSLHSDLITEINDMFIKRSEDLDMRKVKL